MFGAGNTHMMYSSLSSRSPDTHSGLESFEPINWIPLKVPFIKTQLILLAWTSVKRAKDLFSLKSQARNAVLRLYRAAAELSHTPKSSGISTQSGARWVHAIACYAQWTGAPHHTAQRLLVSAAVRGACKLPGKWIVTSLCRGDWS